MIEDVDIILNFPYDYDKLIEILETPITLEKKINIKGKEIIIYPNGDIKYGCTTVVNEDIEIILKERKKTMKK